MAKKEEEKNFPIRRFSGKKSDWPALEEDAVMYFQKSKKAYIGDYARCFFEKFKELTEAAKINKTNFYLILAKHNESVWKAALATRTGIKATTRFNNLKIKWTKDAYG